jgi:hypothetical protein
LLHARILRGRTKPGNGGGEEGSGRFFVKKRHQKTFAALHGVFQHSPKQKGFGALGAAMTEPERSGV